MQATRPKKKRRRCEPNDACLVEELLPDELLCHVLEQLPAGAVAVAARTCRRWFACCPSLLRHMLSVELACSSLPMLQWALANGYAMGKQTCARAAKRGDLDMLVWLQERGCPWSRKACKQAAKGGHLEVLQWLHQKGCPWDERTCRAAAENGHFEVLKWAREQGCHWDSRTMEGAARNGDLDVAVVARRRMPSEPLGLPFRCWEGIFAHPRVDPKQRLYLGRKGLRICGRVWTMGNAKMASREWLSLG
ncbi:Ankyrin repeat domain containing protein [Balamuthia mandrillaris]